MRKYIFLSFCFLSLVGCERTSSQRSTSARNEITSFSGISMTIPYRIEIGKPLTEEQQNEVRGIIETTFGEIDTIYNKWNPDSEISILNRLKANEKRLISAKLAKFLERCAYFVKLSDGKFDPTIEPIQALWRKHLETNTLPTQADIDALRPCIGWHNIVLRNTTFSKKHDLTALDLGGIVKGYAVDLFVERLKTSGLDNVFVEWGGEVKASGSHPKGRNWAVYIPNLDDYDPDHALAYVPLINQAIATSGDYLQQWTITRPEKKVVYFHVFDPQTLRPLSMTEESIASASCLTNDCLTADALATMLLMCSNLDEARSLAEKLQKEIPNTSFWLMSRKEV